MNTEEINFAFKIRHALNEQLDTMPPAATDRLAAARKMAMSRKKPESRMRALAPQLAATGAAMGTLRRPAPSWLGRLGTLAPIVAGIVLFVAVYQGEQQKRINETAEIDAAVLSDELPLSAYVDHGFNAFLAKRGE